MNNCGAPVFQGLSDCKAALQAIEGMIISQKGAAKYTAAELETITKTKGYLSTENAIVAIYIPLNKFQITTEGIKFETSATGKKRNYEKSLPSATAFMDASFLDYAAMFGIDNSEVDIELITMDGLRIMTPTTDVKYKGFRGVINVEQGIPDPEKKLEQFPIYISFNNSQEFIKMSAFAMNFTATDIQDCNPVGLDIKATAEMSSGDIAVKCTKRASSTGFAGLTDVVVLDSNVTTPAVALTDLGGGAYTFACTKATSTDLATGDWIDIIAYKVATTTVTHITNIIRIYGKT